MHLNVHDEAELRVDKTPVLPSRWLLCTRIRWRHSSCLERDGIIAHLAALAVEHGLTLLLHRW